jgi:flagellar biosynthesis/type III secretory pathway M-ring protein FliF/YscJ
MVFVTVSNAATPAEADLVRSRLEANGFMVNLKDDNDAVSFGFGLPIGGMQIQVPEDQAENARGLLASQGPPSSDS